MKRISALRIRSSWRAIAEQKPSNNKLNQLSRVSSSSSSSSVIDKEMEELNMEEWVDLFPKTEEKSHELSLWQKEIKRIETEKFYENLEKMDYLKLLQAYDEEKTKDSEDNPSLNSLLSQQLWNECESQREWAKGYIEMVEGAQTRQDYSALSAVKKCLIKWYTPLKTAIEAEQKAFYMDAHGAKTRLSYGPYLALLQPEKLAVITANECTNMALENGMEGAKVASMATRLGSAVEAEVNVQRLLQSRRNKLQQQPLLEHSTSTGRKKGKLTWSYTPKHLLSFLEEINKEHPYSKRRLRVMRANKHALKILHDKSEWDLTTKAKVGAALIHLLLQSAFFNENEPVFRHEVKWWAFNKKVGFITLHPQFYELILGEKNQTLAPFTTRFQPMVLPPIPWQNLHKGAYFCLKAELMRTKGCALQNDVLKRADLSIMLEALNYLGCIPWNIQENMLKVAHDCWDNNISIGDVPSKYDFKVPDKPSYPKEKNAENYKLHQQKLNKHMRFYQRNMDLRSLRCSLFLKLGQAEKFAKSKIYFPYNLDFRGRVYPIPPHLSNVGSDLSRSLLKFHEKKPLGERGLYWLFVHLANLVGKDKISFDERSQYTEDNLEHVYNVVKDPMKYTWWREDVDEPFQVLATCFEIQKALTCGHDPREYESGAPIHMDGSCNGLQHYAALGLDPVGALAVNLIKDDKPQDVYSGVMMEVIKKVNEHAHMMEDEEIYDREYAKLSQKFKDKDKIKKELEQIYNSAKLVNGFIDRGVVKRTVMTSVYGVTHIGARKQIREKIEEKIQKDVDIDDMELELHKASGYLAKVTMDAIGELFTGARETMNWLATCARLITTQEHPVAWITPLGLPVVQPYRQAKPFTVVTLVQQLILAGHDDDLPIHKARQVTAFPPNYVHSLDSSHMLLTAIEMKKQDKSFSAVHDSFWTHACDVDEMNLILRKTFIELYNKPLLEELKGNWDMRYPEIEFPDVPKKGNLDLNCVLDSPYFFQ